jgi:hypothetical protein
MVTLELYESAKRHLSTLDTQRRKLEAKLEEIREWETDLNKDFNEFEKMRRDAQRDLVFEFLDHVPVGDGLKLFKEKASSRPRMPRRSRPAMKPSRD